MNVKKNVGRFFSFCRDSSIQGWRFLYANFAYIVFIAFAILHTLKLISVDGYGITLFILAFLPKLLPLIAANIESIKFGDFLHAITSGKNRSSLVQAQPDQDRQTKEQPVAPPKPNVPWPAPKSPTSLGLPAARILATMWHFQRDTFGETAHEQRWGFSLGNKNPEFPDYQKGVQKLLISGLVWPDSDGLIYLSDDGLNFVIEHRQELERLGPYYEKFGMKPRDN